MLIDEIKPYTLKQKVYLFEKQGTPRHKNRTINTLKPSEKPFLEHVKKIGTALAPKIPPKKTNQSLKDAPSLTKRRNQSFSIPNNQTLTDYKTYL